MTLAINSKNIVVDTNINLMQSSIVNRILIPIYMTVQSQYVVKMQCNNYIDSASSVLKSFLPTDRFMAVIGNQSWKSSALVEVRNVDFNYSGDWAEVDPSIGNICFRLSLNDLRLLTDISGLASKAYCMQVWCIDSDSNLPYLVSSGNITINNVVVEI